MVTVVDNSIIFRYTHYNLASVYLNYYFISIYEKTETQGFRKLKLRHLSEHSWISDTSVIPSML